jgi:UDP-N-acetylglucosamine diphosphorylase / glucose-1-phosphate thymidylyltransferase / UDP-N-acetylgalactosamine diphosphorylase / glucosamine-1-phosphate N-acetyltransferase / galactosamine-1-phosphate N-acetyltransferase
MRRQQEERIFDFVMKAVILAAGRGTRMKELTAEIPKPMVQVRGKPVLEHILVGLRDKAGIRDFFIVVGYQAKVIRDYFSDGASWGVRISYGVQEVQDGTGKAADSSRAWVGETPFLLTCGDMLLSDSTDYAFFVEAWAGDGCIAIKDGEDLTKGGAVVLDAQGHLRTIVEKGAAESIPENSFYNLATYLLKPQIFAFTAGLEKSPRGEFEFTDALKAWAQAGGQIKGVKFKNKWVDVRDPETLAALNRGA